MLFIFDWDGTLSDSTAKIIMCMQEAAIELNLEPRPSLAIQNIIGLAMPEALRTLYPEVNEAQLQDFHQVYAKHFLQHDHEPSAFFPKVLSTLKHLREQGFLLAVATGKSRQGLDRVLSKLEMHSFFDFSRCADESASKPSPLMLQQLLDESRLQAHQAVMIGDTEWDMRMAAELGMPKVAVSYGAHSIERLEACDPDWLIDDLGCLKKWRFDF